MDFSGRYELQSQENVELFMDVLGVPDDMIEKIKDLRRVTKIVQNGEDFIVAIQTGDEVLVNNFTLGQETHVQTPAGDKIKAVMNLEGGNKLVVKAKDFTSVAEFNGDQLTNTITFGDVVYKQISKKVEEPDAEEDHL
ncbi:fatty acid-binding protein 1, liver-like [Chiloscyllium plagiosum]|uniref:fatty acid-binding protein 1, liver-like n=1 Tax=Chiloscyllium plagiosum TaxID=36176 RepID=UPI001CB83E34|nr:fatty acid-binding protein 1, liver-like [Chiloscyllium plagiosum]